MKLRVHLDGARTGAWNMARDAELLAGHRPGDDPVLRVYRWEPAAVTIGYNQQFADFAGERIAARGYDLVRRPTGGRAILHADELTYAVIGSSPSPLFGTSLHDTYMKINAALLLFLSRLGLDADISEGESRAEARGLVCFRSAGRHEVKVGGRKLIGSAQRRTEGVFLQHGSILAGPRHLELVELLGAEGAAAPDAAALREVTTDLGVLLGRPQAGAALDALGPALADACAEVFDLPWVEA
ncbi:lipoate--protein ligase family protein [bacterium]|nr:lipoate--protein ligase family protein [bacterium]